jgi:hypothetical protein
MLGRWQRRAGVASMIFRLSLGHLLRQSEKEKGAKPMKKTIQLDEETTRLIDEARGNLSRSKYLDALLKKYQGVTLHHTQGADCPKRRKKPKP